MLFAAIAASSSEGCICPVMGVGRTTHCCPLFFGGGGVSNVMTSFWPPSVVRHAFPGHLQVGVKARAPPAQQQLLLSSRTHLIVIPHSRYFCFFLCLVHRASSRQCILCKPPPRGFLWQCCSTQPVRFFQASCTDRPGSLLGVCVSKAGSALSGGVCALGLYPQGQAKG